MLQIVDFLVFINFEWNIPLGVQSIQQKKIVIAFSKLKNLCEKLNKRWVGNFNNLNPSSQFCPTRYLIEPPSIPKILTLKANYCILVGLALQVSAPPPPLPTLTANPLPRPRPHRFFINLRAFLATMKSCLIWQRCTEALSLSR